MLTADCVRPIASRGVAEASVLRNLEEGVEQPQIDVHRAVIPLDPAPWQVAGT